MKTSIKTLLSLSFLTLMAGCGDRTDYTLSPPQNAKWVTVDFKLPEGVTLLPIELLYRSDRDQCLATRYNSSNEPYSVQGYNDVEKDFSHNKFSDIWQVRAAINGGGSCKWQLNSIKVSFRLSENNPLTKGKKSISTSYIFDFGNYGLSDGYGTGKSMERNGNITISTEFFPVTSILKMFNKEYLELYGGDTKNENWGRRFRLNNTREISIRPIISLEKTVSIESRENEKGLIVKCPNGTTEVTHEIYPDYEKLLSMK